MWQILKRHYAPYTPEMVERVCGVPQDLFARICDLFVENSGRERTTAFVHGVGWTQHTIGSQYIRAASILQLLLGNMGRPGGGVMAMRGHASIQGSSDIPTLFDTLPGLHPDAARPRARDLDAFIAGNAPRRGFWGNMRDYTVSLLKAWWGDAATADNDFCFDYLPRLTGSHSTYDTVMEQIAGTVEGYFLFGAEPGGRLGQLADAAAGDVEARLARRARLLADRVARPGGRTARRSSPARCAPRTSRPRCSSSRPPPTPRRTARSRTRSGWCSGTTRRSNRSDDQRSDLWFTYHLGRRIRERLAGSDDERDRPVLDLTWDYPTEGEHDEPERRGGAAPRSAAGTPTARCSSAYTELKADGSTSCGCWIYCGCYADGVNQTARRTPAHRAELDGRRVGVGVAGQPPDPLQPRLGRPRGQAVERAQGARLVGRGAAASGRATTRRTSRPTSRRTTARPRARPGPEAIAGDDPFIMQADGRGWLFAPAGVADGPLPTHYEPQDSPVRNLLHGRQRNPARQVYEHENNRYHPDPDEPGADVFPYGVTTYRLTEHFTAGGMSRWTPYLAELQPEFFCEVSPELAAERGLEHARLGDAVSARGAIEARVMVTDRMTPLRVDGRVVHQIGMPYHWGPNGYARGDSMNELSSMSLDPSSHIQEVKALTVDIQPGPPPAGPGAPGARRAYRERAGITDADGDGAVRPDERPPSTSLLGGERPGGRRRPHRRIRRGWASSPTRRSASAARRARWPARSGTRCPRTA